MQLNDYIEDQEHTQEDMDVITCRYVDIETAIYMARLAEHFRNEPVRTIIKRRIEE